MPKSLQTGLFLDCGGHVGESILHFKKTTLYADTQWDIHTFEPCNELADKMLCRDDGDVTVHKKAVWINDGEVDFYLTDGRSDYYGVEDVPWGSSTVMKEKTSGNVNPDNMQSVPCMDLSAFIKENSANHDLVILKMDIEGAEYDVLEYLLETGAMNAINILMVEYHYRKVKVSFWRHFKLKRRLKKLGITIIEERKGHVSGDWFHTLSDMTEEA
ncbi:MAG: FkbM family methyltransferase [Bdellovibrionales bacterium]